MIRSLFKNTLRPFNFIKLSNLRNSYTDITVRDWIASLPEDKQKRVKLIQNEIILRIDENKHMAPLELLNKADYQEMLELSSNQRQKYYEYLYSTKMSESHDEITKMIAKSIYNEKKQLGTLGQRKSDHIQYGLGHNTQFFKIGKVRINKWRNLKLWRAMIHSAEPDLIFDCGFDYTMSNHEIYDLARQIKFSFSENRLNRKPFVLNLCNMSPYSQLWNALSYDMQNFEKLPWKISAGDVTEVFSTEKLVYLTPDSPNQLENFNADDCYVLGAIVDKGNRQPLTLAKTKRLGIRSARLPLEKYIKYHSHQTLTLDQMIRIMLELKHTKDWKRALKHIPSRLTSK